MNFQKECTTTCVWSEWGAWGDCSPDCTDGMNFPSYFKFKILLGYKIRRRTNNEDDGASCDGDGADTAKCSDNTNTCPSCFNFYENCEKIPTSYCTDFRFQDDMELLCNRYCGKCSDRRRRHSARAEMTIQPIYISHLDELLQLL